MTLAPARVPCWGRPPSSDISNGRRALLLRKRGGQLGTRCPTSGDGHKLPAFAVGSVNTSTSSPRWCRSECNDERNASLTSKDQYVASEQNRRRNFAL